MSAVPKKKRRGRPRGSKNKPKVIQPEAIQDDDASRRQDLIPPIVELEPVIPEMQSPERIAVESFFGLGKIEHPVVESAHTDEVFVIPTPEPIEPVVIATPVLLSDLAKPEVTLVDVTQETIDKMYDGKTESESPSTELKSILRQIQAMAKDLSRYPMDSGLRGGMNEIELLLVRNREKFTQ